MTVRLAPIAIFVIAASFSLPATAGGYSSEPETRTKGIYTTHAPGLKVKGRYQAGPCIDGADTGWNRYAEYQPGVDAHGNPVIPADLPSHDAVHWAGPSLQYLNPRAPTAAETQFGLQPRDYVVLDNETGAVFYNDALVSDDGHLPPLPDHCQ